MALETIENQKWPEDGLERVECCPICGEPDRKLLHAELTDRVFFCAPGKWSLYQCTSCGTGYLDPRPTSDTIKLAYETYYTHDSENNNSAGGKFAQFKRSLTNDYLNNKYNTNLQPASNFGRWVTYFWPQKRKAIDERVRHLSSDRKPGILVDIGCGNGQFLDISSKLGWEAWGVDLDPKAVETARKTGANVIQGGFPNTGLPTAHFDVVTLSHVIEHVHDPIAALQEVFRILKPGGQLWLATPNLDSFGHYRFAEAWRGLEPPRHLTLFTKNSIRYALKKSNFSKIYYKACRQQTIEFYQNSYHILTNNESNRYSLPWKLIYYAVIENLITKYDSTHCENIVLIATRS